MNTTTIVIGLVLAAMLVQYVLAWRQARRFSAEVAVLAAGGPGAVSVGIGRRRGRRLYLAIRPDADGRRVEDALVMSGVTVFATPQPCPALVGSRLTQLRDSSVTGHSFLVTAAAAQAAEFALSRSVRAGATTG